MKPPWKYECDIGVHLGDQSLSCHDIVERIADQLLECQAFDDTLYSAYLKEFLELDECDLAVELRSILPSIYSHAEREMVWMGNSSIPLPHPS